LRHETPTVPKPRRDSHEHEREMELYEMGIPEEYTKRHSKSYHGVPKHVEPVFCRHVIVLMNQGRVLVPEE
jgi:hypothetical protein